MDLQNTTKTWYVYTLVRPDGRVFYVGKGSGKRIYQHEIEARSGHKCHKCNVIRKILKQGGTVQKFFMLETDNEQEAFDYECELIALYGRANLTNLTDGGEGPSGQIISETTRAKLRAHWNDPEYKAKMRLHKLGSKASLETRQRMSDAGRRRYQQAGELERRRQQSVEMWSDPEFHERMKGIQKIAQNRPDVLARRSEISKANAATPEGYAQRVKILNDPRTRAKNATATAEAQRRPEIREMKRQETLTRNADPDYRARMLEIKQDPALRAQIGASVTAWTQRNPEQHAANVAKRKAIQSTPEYRANMAAKTKARMADPAVRAKMSEDTKRQFSSAESRALQSERAKGQVASPEARAKMSASGKESWARRKAQKEATKGEDTP